MSSSCSDKCGADKQSTCGSRPAVAARENVSIDQALGRIRHKILVMSGKGGVGKSTVAVNLAVGLAGKGFRVGLMDVDLHGPDISRMLNLSDTPTTSSEGRILPLPAGDNLRVISLENMMENRDDPIIWRGPLKYQAIRRFIADVDWGELDYLVIDAPPGTGDEPMTVAQTIKDAKALVVTTPQKVALADVRKSINFCGHVGMKVLGLVENMSGFVCPHCGKTAELFKSGGGERLAQEFDLPFLGRIPLDPRVMLSGDDGSPFLTGGESPAVTAMSQVVARVNAALPVATGVPHSLAATPAATSTCGCGGKCDPNLCDC
ncbi:MAG TPA: ATP-binding protein [Desulfurivibrio alkaliphilus]|uniref:Iron-sulfur cluster carrier protein n=1 Tax=Desulfurivibrio alkaliphilus TaxID=427923 RepID=A0A7C2TLH5_9BACT|nr:ATP-binding protein [Desulfurivibrio alkaliphilus]